VWLVTASFMTGAATCSTYMWINPDPSATSLDTAVADVKRSSGMPSGFDRVRLECGGNDAMQTNWDEIRIGTDWISVSSPLAPVGVKDLAAQNLPKGFELSQNYPNPFNPTTQLSYSVKLSGFISLKVYNLLGQQVASLFEGVRPAGNYQATFNAENLPSGVYFARLQNGTNSVTKKMMLLK
jgi:hypothetical protein